MWAANYWQRRFWPANEWPKRGFVPAPVVAGTYFASSYWPGTYWEKIYWPETFANPAPFPPPDRGTYWTDSYWQVAYWQRQYWPEIGPQPVFPPPLPGPPLPTDLFARFPIYDWIRILSVSRIIRSVAYNRTSLQMQIVYNGGQTTVLANVMPDLAEAFTASSSPDQFFLSYILGKFPAQ